MSCRNTGDYVKHARRRLQKRSLKQSVLIVNDNPTITQVVSQAFRLDGFAICGEADDGRQAIELAKKTIPDLIVLDLSIPVMNGLQAAPQLRKVAPNASIILLTLYGSELSPDHQASKVGIDLVVSKTEALSSFLDKAHSLASDIFHRRS